MPIVYFTMITEILDRGRKMIEPDSISVSEGDFEKLSVKEIANKRANEIINNFNNTLRPYESKRKLIGVVKVSSNLKSNAADDSRDRTRVRVKHIWKKKNLVTNRDGSDTLVCKTCGLEAKRFALGSEPSVPVYKRHQKYMFSCPGEEVE